MPEEPRIAVPTKIQMPVAGDIRAHSVLQARLLQRFAKNADLMRFLREATRPHYRHELLHLLPLENRDGGFFLGQGWSTPDPNDEGEQLPATDGELLAAERMRDGTTQVLERANLLSAGTLALAVHGLVALACSDSNDVSSMILVDLVAGVAEPRFHLPGPAPFRLEVATWEPGSETEAKFRKRARNCFKDLMKAYITERRVQAPQARERQRGPRESKTKLDVHLDYFFRYQALEESARKIADDLVHDEYGENDPEGTVEKAIDNLAELTGIAKRPARRIGGPASS